jgi:hypothetical protein
MLFDIEAGLTEMLLGLDISSDAMCGLVGSSFSVTDKGSTSGERAFSAGSSQLIRSSKPNG